MLKNKDIKIINEGNENCIVIINKDKNEIDQNKKTKKMEYCIVGTMATYYFNTSD